MQEGLDCLLGSCNLNIDLDAESASPLPGQPNSHRSSLSVNSEGVKLMNPRRLDFISELECLGNDLAEPPRRPT